MKRKSAKIKKTQITKRALNLPRPVVRTSANKTFFIYQKVMPVIVDKNNCRFGQTFSFQTTNSFLKNLVDPKYFYEKLGFWKKYDLLFKGNV